MKECKISKYLSVKKVLGAKNFKRNKMIQNYRDQSCLEFNCGQYSPNMKSLEPF